MKPEEFIATTDYATLKNDNTAVLSVTLPSSLNISGYGFASYTDSANIGVPGSSIRAAIHSTKDNNWYVGTSIPPYIYLSGATVDGSSVGYDVVAIVSRVSPTVVRLYVTIKNPYSTTLSISGLSQTITARVATFLPPYP